MNNSNKKNSNAKTKNVQRGNRRRTKRGANKGNNQVARSNGNTNSVQNRLSSKNSTRMYSGLRAEKVMDMPYARCRLNPFNSGPSMGLPDSNAVNKLVFDHRSVQDFAVNGNASLLILPCLPFGAAIKPDGGTAAVISIGGSSVTQAGTFNLPLSWIPINWYPDTISTGVPNVSPLLQSVPPVSNKLRLVGVAFRLICTSPAVNINGIIECVDSELAVGQTEDNTNPITMTNCNEAAPSVFAPGTVSVRTVSMSTLERTQQAIHRTVQMRPETMPQGVLKHNGPYLWSNSAESAVVTVPSQDLGSAFFTLGAGVDSGKYGAVYLWDEAFSVKRIRISTNQPVGFRLETIACLEYVIAPTNPFARIATPKVKVDTRSVEIVDAALGNMPAMMTPSANEAFINRLFRTVSKTASSVGNAFGPTGAAIGGGVALITDALANVL